MVKRELESVCVRGPVGPTGSAQATSALRRSTVLCVAAQSRRRPKPTEQRESIELAVRREETFGWMLSIIRAGARWTKTRQHS